jgi:Glycopeptide antibiotics resistance protein
MPMGFLLPIIFEKLRNLIKIITVIFLISTVLEMTQLWQGLGIADIDDIILNTLGGVMGYILLGISYKDDHGS